MVGFSTVEALRASSEALSRQLSRIDKARERAIGIAAIPFSVPLLLNAISESTKSVLLLEQSLRSPDSIILARGIVEASLDRIALDLDLNTVVPLLTAGSSFVGGLKLGRRGRPDITKEIEGWERSLESAQRRGDVVLQHAARAEIYALYMRLHPRGLAGVYAFQAVMCGLLWATIITMPLTATSENVKFAAAIGQLIVGMVGALFLGKLISVVQDEDGPLGKQYYALWHRERKQLMELSKDVPPPPRQPDPLEAVLSGLREGGWIAPKRAANAPPREPLGSPDPAGGVEQKG